MEDVLLNVLQELKTLKEEVKDLKERQNSTEANQKNQDTSTTSTVQPSSSEARPPLGANESESRPMHISPTAQGPSSPLAFVSHPPSALSQVAQVPSSTLPLGAQRHLIQVDIRDHFTQLSDQLNVRHRSTYKCYQFVNEHNLVVG